MAAGVFTTLKHVDNQQVFPVFKVKSGSVVHIAGKKVIPLFDVKIDYVNHLKGGKEMSKEERKELVERIAEKFTRASEGKDFIAGYLTRAMEEHGQHEKQTA